MTFKDFHAPVLFSSTFKALNLGEKIQVLSSTFKDAWEPWQNVISMCYNPLPELHRMHMISRGKLHDKLLITKTADLNVHDYITCMFYRSCY